VEGAGQRPPLPSALLEAIGLVRNYLRARVVRDKTALTRLLGLLMKPLQDGACSLNLARRYQRQARVIWYLWYLW
jgi:hypothetical protein